MKIPHRSIVLPCRGEPPDSQHEFSVRKFAAGPQGVQKSWGVPTKKIVTVIGDIPYPITEKTDY